MNYGANGTGESNKPSQMALGFEGSVAIAGLLIMATLMLSLF
jgi:hypothetical protein